MLLYLSYCSPANTGITVFTVRQPTPVLLYLPCSPAHNGISVFTVRLHTPVLFYLFISLPVSSFLRSFISFLLPSRLFVGQSFVCLSASQSVWLFSPPLSSVCVCLSACLSVSLSLSHFVPYSFYVLLLFFFGTTVVVVFVIVTVVCLFSSFVLQFFFFRF